MLDTEYDQQVAANGGRPLYIPDDLPIARVVAGLRPPTPSPAFVMKNKLSDLNDHLFSQLERLTDDTLSDADLDRETLRAAAMAQVADKIVANARLQVDAYKLVAEHAETFRNGLPMLAPVGGE